MMKKISKDGKEYYYYYQRKVGRHRKRGRKKAKKKRGRRWQETWDYKIMRFDFHRQAMYIGLYHDLDEANFVKRILEKRNADVLFPKKYTSNVRKDRKVYDFKSEYVILKRVKDGESNVTQLRNEYGKFVDQKTTNENWAIADKFPCLEEETFWVYGYNPHTERKTFRWILDNLVITPAEEKENLVMIYIYLNKVIFKYEDDFTFVVCKNNSDAIRMYNLIEEMTKKTRNVLLTGATVTKSDRGQMTIDMLEEKTGWTRRKITSNSTRT